MGRFVRKSLRLLLLYGPLLFIPAFLYLAYNYISSKSPQYKVSAAISLKDVPQQTAIKDLKSKELINSVLDRMSLEASYFFADQPRQEIYPDSSPVKVVVKNLKNGPNPVWISLRATDAHQFELTRGDTSEFYRFREPISENYGTFVVVRNPRVDMVEKPVIVELLSRPQMITILNNDLHVGAGHKADIVQLALVTGNPKKGADFLNALLNIYGGTIRRDDNAAPATKTITTVQHDTIKKSGKDVRILKSKIADLTNQIASLKELEKSAGTTVQVRTGGVDKDQAKIYQAVDSYIKQPVDQFVQVPYVDEIEDPELNDQVNEFNELELSRRHYTAQAQVDSMNRKLMTLRSSIVEQIHAYLRIGQAESTTRPPKSYYEAQVAAKQRRLDEINSEISAAGTAGFTVVKNNKEKTISVAGASSKLVVVEKPQDNVEYIPVNAIKIYVIAFLAGLLFPIAGWIVRVVHRNSSSRRRLTEPGKLDGQLNDFFHVKQVD
ncbi:MAG TPA: hypothetical protein VG367_19805 [Mucilaginibacter sp.]|nr:hypothetical protein [Mucilaginibacter sp.]